MPMTVFNDRPALPASRRKRLLGLPLIIALVWAGLALHHSSWHQALTGRSGASADSGPSRSMDSSLQIRRFLLLHRRPKLSLGQSEALVASVGSPVDDQSQSEALDVLSLALRAHALSTAQAQAAQSAAIQVLRCSPGPMVRLESARLLGHLAAPGGIPALLILQRDSDPKIQSAARTALVRIQK